MNDGDTLRKLQLFQLKILRVVDRFCRDNGIRYSLYDGTLLGAVRHGGFIPWDDDLDICMTRNEYNRFILLWSLNPPTGYIIQNKENTPSFTQSFTKIRMEGTAFVQTGEESGKYHTGIFIDIFPLDRLPPFLIGRGQFLLKCMVYQLLNREFIPPKASTLTRFVSGAMLKMIRGEKRQRLRTSLLQDITRLNDNQSLETVGIETIKWVGKPMPKNLFDEYINIQFEDAKYMCFKNWDGLLKSHFGDYMTLPPESERTWKHHPIILDFEHDYEELMNLKNQGSC